MYLNKKKRHEIINALNLSGIKVSTGSISNIISEWRQNQTTSTEVLGNQPAQPNQLKNLHTLPEEVFVETKEQSETSQSAPLKDSEDLEVSVNQKRALEIDLAELDSEKLQLQKEIEEGRKILDMHRKAVGEFAVVKAEIAATGIEPSRFSNVITAFKKYGYNCGEIMSGFAEVMDINETREQIKRQQQEIDKQKQTLDCRLEETNNERAFKIMLNTLGISPDELKKGLKSLMTLEQQDVSLDQLINYSRTLHQTRRQQWERGSNWSANHVVNKNGGYNQDQGYVYGY